VAVIAGPTQAAPTPIAGRAVRVPACPCLPAQGVAGQGNTVARGDRLPPTANAANGYYYMKNTGIFYIL
jgi:hypothetical protein